MKNLFQIVAVAFGMFVSTNVHAQCGAQANQWSSAGASCSDQATGECYCLYVHYEPNYYSVPRYVEEKIPCTKKCCRMVDQYYEVQKCRYVPEYYSETYCVQVPEYYEVPDCKTCTKCVYDTQVEYIPQYYWKHTCAQPQQPACAKPVSQQSSCQQNSWK